MIRLHADAAAPGAGARRAAGIEHTLDDPRFASQPQFATAEDAQEWEDLLWEAFRTKTYDEWLPILRADATSPSRWPGRSEEGLDHPQIVHNGDVITVDDPDLRPGASRSARSPTSRRRPLEIDRSAPGLGDHRGDRSPATLRPTPATGPRRRTRSRASRSSSSATSTPCRTASTHGGGARRPGHQDRGPRPATRCAAASATRRSTAVRRRWRARRASRSTCARPRAARSCTSSSARADVFVTGFRPGVAERLGLDYETLRALNPRLVYVHAAGYGTDGPYAHRPIYAQAAQAAGRAASAATPGTGSTRADRRTLSPSSRRPSCCPASRPRRRRLQRRPRRAVVAAARAVPPAPHRRGPVRLAPSMIGGNASPTPTTSALRRQAAAAGRPTTRTTGCTRSTGCTRPGRLGVPRRAPSKREWERPRRGARPRRPAPPTNASPREAARARRTTTRWSRRSATCSHRGRRASGRSCSPKRASRGGGLRSELRSSPAPTPCCARPAWSSRSTIRVFGPILRAGPAGRVLGDARPGGAQLPARPAHRSDPRRARLLARAHRRAHGAGHGLRRRVRAPRSRGDDVTAGRSTTSSWAQARPAACWPTGCRRTRRTGCSCSKPAARTTT